MKNTKEITTGAMLLAIYGVVLLLDRYLSYFFIDLIPLIEAIAIITYGNKYGFKNGLFISVAFFLISFVLTPELSFIYYSLVGILAANMFNILLKNEVNSFTLILSVMIVFSIAELLDKLALSSIFYGESFFQLIIEITDIVKDMIQSLAGTFDQGIITELSSLMLNQQTVGTLIIIACIITGIMEGLLVYILSAVLFNRLNINAKISFNHILTLKPATAYVLFGISCLIIINRFVFYPILSPIIIGLSSIAMFVLAYFGYIYLMVLIRIKYNKSSLLLILLIIITLPMSLLVLFIIGFLYGAGPLKKYLVIERKTDE